MSEPQIGTTPPWPIPSRDELYTGIPPRPAPPVPQEGVSEALLNAKELARQSARADAAEARIKELEEKYFRASCTVDEQKERIKELEALIKVAGKALDRIPGGWTYWEPNEDYVERMKALAALAAAEKEGK